MTNEIVYVVRVRMDDRTHADRENLPGVLEKELAAFSERAAKFYTRGSIPAVEVKLMRDGLTLLLPA